MSHEKPSSNNTKSFWVPETRTLITIPTNPNATRPSDIHGFAYAEMVRIQMANVVMVNKSDDPDVLKFEVWKSRYLNLDDIPIVKDFRELFTNVTYESNTGEEVFEHGNVVITGINDVITFHLTYSEYIV